VLRRDNIQVDPASTFGPLDEERRRRAASHLPGDAQGPASSSVGELCHDPH
jgi:hypothetical protein